MTDNYFIPDTRKVKTTWHPLSLIERGWGGGGGY